MNPKAYQWISAKVLWSAITTLVLLISSVVWLALRQVDSAHAAALQRGEEQVMRFAAGAQASVNRSLLAVDMLLASVDELLALNNGELGSTQANHLLSTITDQTMLVRRLTVHTPQGSLVAGSDGDAVENSARLPAGFLKKVVDATLYSVVIGGVAPDGNDTERFLYFGRTFQSTQGHKLLTVAQVPVELLETVLAQGAGAGAYGLELTLERNGGEMLATVPSTGMAAPYKAHTLADVLASSAVAQIPSRINGEPALVTARRTLYKGLYITTALPMARALAPWVAESRAIWWTSSVLIGFLVLIAALVLWYLSRLGHANAQLQESAEVVNQALNSMSGGFVMLDNQHRLALWNQQYEVMIPGIKGQLRPQMPWSAVFGLVFDAINPNASEAERQEWITTRARSLLESEGAVSIEYPSGQKLEASISHMPNGGVVAVTNDVTQRKANEREIERLAFYDPLTGLPNRRLLMDRLQQVLAIGARAHHQGAILFLDLDHFKVINDTLGHDIGDQLLQQVAQRLSASVRQGDTVARLGGDEFVVVVVTDGKDAGVDATAHATAIGQKVLTALSQPYRIGAHSHHATCSIGATLYGTHQHAIDELLKQADLALYDAKSAGRNTLRFFDPAMQTTINARSTLERDLRAALATGQFFLHYQAQWDGRGQLVGAEALLRWDHPHRGTVLPMEFVPLAEETGLILPIGLWVLHVACAQLKVWQSNPLRRHLELSVNVSAHQFRQAHFVGEVLHIVRQTGAPAHLLKLELTESVVLHDVSDAIQKMQILRNAGVRFSLDDFGTGHSSLSYLTRFPLCQLKIDQSFVHNLGKSRADALIVQTILGMAKNLGLEVIAEGVETQEQYRYLLDNGCALFQGFLFGKPAPISDFDQALHPLKNT